MQGRLRWEPSPVPPASAATRSLSAPRASEESSVKERQRMLSQRIQERDRLRDSTQARLGEEDAFLMHWRWRDEAAERRAHLRIRIKEAQRALIRVVEKLDGLVTSVHVRAKEVAAAKDKSNILSELHRQRQFLVRQLRVTLPLQTAVVESPDVWDGSERVTQVIRICGFRLPEDDNPLTLPPGELAVALGYLLHFIDILATYLSSPILHCASFAASSSKIWQRASYLDSQPAASKQGSSSQSRRCPDTLSDSLCQKQMHRDLSVKPRAQMLVSSTPRAKADHQQGVDDHKSTSKSHAEELKRQKDVAYEAWKQAEAARFQEETHFEGWDLIDPPYLPPPPSEEENVEHWARAMFIDITK
eukprot:SM000002S05684  [mRNA]  locus=s2:1556129:1560228:- [translate_table: standard]